MAEPAASANTGTKRRSYSKISVVEESKHSSKKKASEMFKVPRSCVIDWCKEEEKIRDEFKSSLRSAKRCRLLGAGQKPAARNLEELLHQWFVTEYEEKKLAVSRKLMITKAKELQKQLGEAQERSMTL